VGVLEVLSDCYIDESPLFYPEDDPYVVRFKVRPAVWLPKEKAVPIHEKHVWDGLSFTRGCDPSSSVWTGKVRISLNKVSDEDGQFLEKLLSSQESGGESYPVDEEKYRRLRVQKVRRTDKVVPVTVPGDDEEEDEPEPPDKALSIRESAKIQALIATVGEKMGFNLWLHNNDRATVLQQVEPGAEVRLVS